MVGYGAHHFWLCALTPLCPGADSTDEEGSQEQAEEEPLTSDECVSFLTRYT